MSDNFHFDMTGVGHPLALPVAFTHHKLATHWFEMPGFPRPTNTNTGKFDFKLWKEQYGDTHRTEHWPQPVAPRFVLCWAKPHNNKVQPAGFGGYYGVRDNRPDLHGVTIEVEINAFPGKGLDAEAIWPFADAWLKDTHYGGAPDHDGDNGKGYRIFNEAWGHVCGMYEAFVGIEPAWLMYGK